MKNRTTLSHYDVIKHTLKYDVKLVESKKKIILKVLFLVYYSFIFVQFLQRVLAYVLRCICNEKKMPMPHTHIRSLYGFSQSS